MTGKNKNKKNSVKNVLKQIPEKDLRKFVSKELGIQEVLNDFMAEFKDYFMNGDSAEAYIDQIISAFIDATEDYGYISFDAQSNLLQVVIDAAEAADNFREKENYEAAIDICFTILENGIDAINHSDDSFGNLGTIMNEGMQRLHALANPDICTLDEFSRLAFMDQCWNCIEENLFDGWSWHTDMYNFLISLAKKDNEYEDIMESLDNDEYLKKEYHQEILLMMKRALIAKWKGAEAAHEFAKNNLQIQKFREEAIDEALSADDFSQAYQLAIDGIKQDKTIRPGIVPTWNNWMLRIAQKEGNHDLIVEYASLLYLHPWQEQGDFYKLLKETVAEDGWVDFTEKLATQALQMGYREKYADICSREKWYERLMAYVREEKSIHALENYESQLLRTYREEIISMYIHYVNDLMRNSYNRNRNTYREMCRYLTHVKKIGGHDAVKKEIDYLKNEYRRCRALMEELNAI